MKECQKCSACCKNIILPIPDINDDIKHWIELHNLLSVETINDMNYVKIDSPCSMLKDGKCSIHDTRPNVCRDYNCNKKEFKNFT